MGPVIHRINAPFVTGTVMVTMLDAVQNRITHMHIRGAHVDFCTQYPRSIGKFTVFHPLEQVKVFIHRLVAACAFLSGLCRYTPFGGNILRTGFIHIGLAFFYEHQSPFIQLVEVIGCIMCLTLPVESKPLNIFAYGINIFNIFGNRIGIIKPQIALAVILLVQYRN